MEGDKRSNKTFKSTYVNLQNNELHQTMQTGTVPSKLTGRVKKLNHSYKPMYFMLIFTQLARNLKLAGVRLSTVCF